MHRTRSSRLWEERGPSKQAVDGLATVKTSYTRRFVTYCSV